MRVALAGLWHETHTFSNQPADLDAFREFEYLAGPEVLDYHRGKRTGVGGLIDGAAEAGLELVPIFSAGALPSGRVTAEAYQHLRSTIVEGLRAALPVDGLLFALHGAMVAEGEDDVEAALAQEARAFVGPGVPVIATLDLHANNSAALLAAADAIVGYDTYPHVDIYERGLEGARLMGRVQRENVRVTAAIARPPLLPSVQGMHTETAPMRDLIGMAHEIEGDPVVLNVTIAAGFPYSDVERAGLTCTVQTNAKPELAAGFARGLGAFAWSQRAAFQVQNVPPADAVRQAIAAPSGPVILVDVADNVGGGSPGDGTVLLTELLAQRARRAVVALADAESVAQACQAGVGAEVVLRVGGKTDGWHGEPVEVRGRVRLISDGRYVHAGSWMTGREMNMGRSVVLACDGLTLLLSERKTAPFDAGQLRSQGILPEAQHIIVVKSAVAWRAAYGALAQKVIEVDTPGLCSPHLERFPYRKLRRPIYPLDPAADWTPRAEIPVRHP